MPSTLDPCATTRKHELRFRDMVIHSPLGQSFLRAFDEMLQETDSKVIPDVSAALQRETAVDVLVECYHLALVDLGVARGFHNNYMHLSRHDAAIGLKPHLTCRICAIQIDAARDYACNRRTPCCHACSTA